METCFGCYWIQVVSDEMISPAREIAVHERIPKIPMEEATHARFKPFQMVNPNHNLNNVNN